MPNYGIDPHLYLISQNPCFEHVLAAAPSNPVDVYTLAAEHDIDHLATSTSCYLLSYSLFDIPDSMIKRIGAIYTKRLFLLHANRSSELKKILSMPPHPHPQTKQCNFEKQRSLNKAWSLTSGYLTWTAKPDLSPSTIQSSFDSLLELMSCKLCQDVLKTRVKEVIFQWVSVKRTI